MKKAAFNVSRAAIALAAMATTTGCAILADPRSTRDLGFFEGDWAGIEPLEDSDEGGDATLSLVPQKSGRDDRLAHGRVAPY